MAKHTQEPSTRAETLLFGMLLIFIGGYLEAYSYIGRGHVFANGQTGNMALFGMHFMAGNWQKAWRYFVPIPCFAAGVFLADTMKAAAWKQRQLHWQQAVLLLEALFLCGTAFIPAGNTDIYANMVIAVICGLQIEAFRKMKGYAYATTMCTGNLRSATEALFHAVCLKEPGETEKAKHYISVITLFILGAVVGGKCTEIFGIWSSLFCLFPLCICIFLLYEKE